MLPTMADPSQASKRHGEREELVSVSEAAAYLAVHVNTVRRWTRDGFLPCFRVGPRRDRRIRRSDLDRLLGRAERMSYPAQAVRRPTA